MVIGRHQIDIRPHGVFRSGPEDLQISSIREANVADRAERVATDDGGADRQRNRRIDVPDILIAGMSLTGPIRSGRAASTGAVGDRSCDKSRAGLRQLGGGGNKADGERSRGNRVFDVTDDRIERQAEIVDADLALDDIARAAVGSKSPRRRANDQD